MPGKKKRKGNTKEQKELARLLHRTHLLCLLARGLLYDQAASDPMLQARHTYSSTSTYCSVKRCCHDKI